MTLAGALSLSAVEAGLVAARDADVTAARAEARRAFERLGLPHRRVEAYRWSDFRAALRAPIDRASPPDGFPSVMPSLAPAFLDRGAPALDDAFRIEIANGAAEEEAFEPDGLTVRTTLNDRDLPDDLRAHPLAALAAATALRRTDILIDAAVKTPVLIRRMAGAGASSSRVRVVLAPGASATIVETLDAAAGSFAADVTEFEIGEGASVSRHVLQEGDATAVVAAVAHVALARGARFDQTALAFGARLARVETRVDANGDDASVGLSSVCLLAGARHADVTTHVAHRGLSARTTQLHKAALRDGARGVFQGKFLVARGAQKTDARMQARALLLSEGAEANHKPELEIYADDVQCAHGATAGALDGDALFYLRQRGLSEAAAKALLVEAFIDDVFEGVADPALREMFRAHAARWQEAA